MNMYNIKRARDFDGKFPFNSLIILDNMLTNIGVIFNVSLICFLQDIIDQSHSIVKNGLPFHNKWNIEEHVSGK